MFDHLVEDLVNDLEDGGLLRVLGLDECRPQAVQSFPTPLDGQALVVGTQDGVEGALTHRRMPWIEQSNKKSKKIQHEIGGKKKKMQIS